MKMFGVCHIYLTLLKALFHNISGLSILILVFFHSKMRRHLIIYGPVVEISALIGYTQMSLINDHAEVFKYRFKNLV